VAITIAVCAVVYWAGSLADKLIRHNIDNSMGGRISRGMNALPRMSNAETAKSKN